MSTKPAVVSSSAFYLPQIHSLPSWLTPISVLLADLIALSAVYWLAVLGRFLITPGDFRFYIELFPGIALVLAGFSIQGLYPGLLLHPAEEIRRVCYCFTALFLAIACTAFLWHNAELYSRAIFLFTWAAGAPAVVLARYLTRNALAQKNWWGVRAVVLGSGPAALRVIRSLRNKSLGVRVIGVLTEDANDLPGPDSPPILGAYVDAPQVAATGAAEYAILAMPHQSHAELRRLIHDHCKGFRHVLLIPDMPGICSLGIAAREIDGEIGFELPQRLFSRSAAIAKRYLDIFLGATALILIAPLLVFIAILIKATSRGPVIYRHSRYGRDGRTFMALKFRTMARHGDEILAEYLRLHPAELVDWQRDRKLKNDPRVTPIGNLLRRYSLDELPQLWNVLIGEMSLVGPRPIVAEEIDKYGSGYDSYTRVLPGITGLWQVSGRSNTTYEQRVTLDEYYVRNWSIWLDAYILICTVRVVLTREGAY